LSGTDWKEDKGEGTDGQERLERQGQGGRRSRKRKEHRPKEIYKKMKRKLP
jgi:hypothetical protein